MSCLFSSVNLVVTPILGMNFQGMASVQDHNEGLFWIVAAPVITVIIMFLLWQRFKTV